MSKNKNNDNVQNKCGFEEALDATGFGKYNVMTLISCCLLILSLMLDIFGLSVALPALACELELTTNQQGLLSAIPLMGVTVSSYAWGLCADVIGRRKTLLIAMPISTTLNVLSSFAPNYVSLVALKFLSASFTCATNAAGYVLMGESVSRQQRKRCMFVLASSTMCSHLLTAAIALPVLSMTFRLPIPWLNLEYRPWRLLLLIISIPGILGMICLFFLYESSKYLLSKGRDDEALHILRSIYSWNTGLNKKTFPISTIYLDDFMISKPLEEGKKTSFIRKMWNQTAPLFKPPLLKNSIMVYYLLLCAYMTTTGFSIWVTALVNTYFSGNVDHNGKTFCEVASTAARHQNSTITNCDHVIPPFTLYAVMSFSASATVVTILAGLVVKVLGTKGSTLLIFVCSAASGILLHFITIPILSLIFLCLFLHVAAILGNVNTYLVELNPTHLRSMASCLSVVVQRGFSFVSVQIIATFLADHCKSMLTGYILLVISGFVVALFLPSDKKIEEFQKGQNKNIK